MDVAVRQRKLRWPVSRALARDLPGDRFRLIERRAKYLLLRAGSGSVILHLGMSGSLHLVDSANPAGPHDHLDIALDSGRTLRLHDPRRFGSVLWTRADPLRHRLLSGLGPEPLGEEFDGAYLHTRAYGRRAPVKSLLMDGRVVAGVGNIYASEALHFAGIHPRRAAGRISRARYERLADELRRLLAHAIELGGTTLRDFVRSDGTPGYFQLELAVYGREGQACKRCGRTVRCCVIGQRSSFYCPRCQR